MTEKKEEEGEDGEDREKKEETNKVYKYAQVRKQSIKFEAKGFNVFNIVLLAQLLSGI